MVWHVKKPKKFCPHKLRIFCSCLNSQRVFDTGKYQLTSCASEFLVHAQQSGHQHPLIISIQELLEALHTRPDQLYWKSGSPRIVKLATHAITLKKWFKYPVSTLISQTRSWQILSGNFTLESLMQSTVLSALCADVRHVLIELSSLYFLIHSHTWQLLLPQLG